MGRRVIYEGRRVRLALEAVPRRAGGTVEKEVVEHPGAVVLLPLLPGDRVCLVRNDRFAVGETLLELPAGTLEPGEPPEAAARRELAEETGYTAAACRLLTTFFPSPGVLTERMHLFLMEGLTPGEQCLDETERIEPVVLPWPQAVRRALSGEIRDGKTLVGLLLWDRLRKQ
jgi:ADP-ribose pyrophosphatase